MAGKNPPPAATGQRVNFTKQTASIVRNGRPVLINEERFFDWLTDQGAA
jgi:hypothetical protein